MRVFFAPLDVCGIYTSLALGIRELGEKSDFLDLSNQNYSSWNQSDSSLLVRLVAKMHSSIHYGSETPSKLTITLYTVFSWLLVLKIVLIYDAVVLKSGEPISGTELELKLYKLFGVKIISTFHGSDSRPPYLLPNIGCTTLEELNQRSRMIKENVLRAQKYCDVVVDLPLSSQFQNKPCCVGQILGNPIGPTKLKQMEEALHQHVGMPSSSSTKKLMILHAPSNPKLKGSKLVRKAISQLKKEGLDFEYTEITGRSNRDVMIALASADIVVDELYSDMHGAIFAQEGCCAKCAVIVGGYGLEHLNKFVPEDARLPTYFVEPEDFLCGLRKLITEKELREKLVNDAIAFTEGYGHYLNVAKRLVKLIDGTAPKSWFFDPNDIRYVAGAAAPKEKIQTNLANYLEKFGEDSLFLDDKPELKNRIISFASNP